jgi:hypothetical protein
MDKPTSRDFGDFLRAFSHSWTSLLSGGFSIPLAIAGVFWADSPFLKTLFLVTAAACLVFASFQVWWPEHLKAIGAEPRLDILVEADAHSVFNRVRPVSWGPTKQLGVSVRNTGKLQTSNCQVFFDNMTPNEENLVVRTSMLHSPFALNGSEEKVIPLASFEEWGWCHPRAIARSIQIGPANL